MIPSFRAWDGGSLCHMYSPSEVMVGDSCIWILNEDSWEDEWIVNNDLVLMQSTELTDKNGKEIFEGDVVKMAKNVYSEPTYYEVVRHRGGAYRLESKQYGCELWLRHTDCEIAGNIYENPELLEVRT
ncbi:YopX family protein [uncultured Streptococcus sp.]|uniref:YopX family protein n=1 Tax=uncultured Streptococcus sp. TaxID=83427 RepID=UPI0025F350DF|nr:YopX family protein [uncultured Streptococcus sp.]